MIDFRYHLVSIVAVFLALAIGIVLGATELQGSVIDGLRSSSNSLKSQLSAATAKRDAYEQQVNASGTFLQTAEPKLLNGMLAADTGQTMEKVSKDTDRDFIMTAEECVAYGLIDEVITARDTVGIETVGAA